MAAEPDRTKLQPFITYRPNPDPSAAGRSLGAFAVLPLELRRQIYSYFLPCLTAPISPVPNNSRDSDPLALMRTSRHIHEELCDMLYAGRTLIFSITPEFRTGLLVRLQLGPDGHGHAIHFPPSRWARPRWLASALSDWSSDPRWRRMPFERLSGVVIEIHEPEEGDLEWTVISYIGVGTAKKFLANHPERLRVSIVARTREDPGLEDAEASSWSTESKLLAEFPEYPSSPGGDLGMVLMPVFFGFYGLVELHALRAVTRPLEESDIRAFVREMDMVGGAQCMIPGGVVLRIEPDEALAGSRKWLSVARTALDSRVEETMWRCCDEMIWGPYGKTLRNSWSTGHSGIGP